MHSFIILFHTIFNYMTQIELVTEPREFHPHAWNSFLLSILKIFVTSSKNTYVTVLNIDETPTEIRLIYNTDPSVLLFMTE